MNFDPLSFQRLAAEKGFRTEALETVIRMLDLLEGLCAHHVLKSRIVLKGGTALNLFCLDLPRLSVDIDLNYLGSSERDKMIAERPELERALVAVGGRHGYKVRRSPDAHAGGKWRLATSAYGRTRTIEIDINFMHRTPLWTPSLKDSWKIGPYRVHQVPVLDDHELMAGKLVALFDRRASRDLYDTIQWFRNDTLDMQKLRTAFVVYSGMSRRNWSTISLDDIDLTPDEVNSQLLPLLRLEEVPPRSDLDRWTKSLVDECKAHLAFLLPLKPREIEFLALLNQKAEIAAKLLTDDPELQATIQAHPNLHWKAKNVRQHLGL